MPRLSWRGPRSEDCWRATSRAGCVLGFSSHVREGPGSILAVGGRECPLLAGGAEDPLRPVRPRRGAATATADARAASAGVIAVASLDPAGSAGGGVAGEGEARWSSPVRRRRSRRPGPSRPGRPQHRRPRRLRALRPERRQDEFGQLLEIGGRQGDREWSAAGRRGRVLRAVDHGALEHREPAGRGGVRSRQAEQRPGVLAGRAGVEHTHHVLEP